MKYDEYATLVCEAVQREMDVLGDERAVELAREVEGLSVDDGGSVTALDREGVGVLDDLIERYKQESGDVAAFVIARRLEHVIDDAGDVDLPDSLARHL